MNLAPAVVFEDVSFGYENGTMVLDQASFQVPQGEFLVIIGPNGGGKTTLLRLILGLEKPARGKIEVLGTTPDRAVTSVGYVPQEGVRDKIFPVSVFDVVLMGRLGIGRRKIFTEEDKKIAMDVLEHMGLAGRRNDPMGDLSKDSASGFFVVGISLRPRILLMDEPLASIGSRSEGFYMRLGFLCRKRHYHFGKPRSLRYCQWCYGCCLRVRGCVLSWVRRNYGGNAENGIWRHMPNRTRCPRCPSPGSGPPRPSGQASS